MGDAQLCVSQVCSYTRVPTIKLNPFIRSNKILAITNDRRIDNNTRL